MTYLRFCKPSQEINFRSIIFRENKARNLGYTSTTLSANQISVFCVCLLAIFSFLLHELVSKPNNSRFIACCVLQSHGKEFVCLLCAANKTWWKEVVG
jgi:hypothetical protein